MLTLTIIEDKGNKVGKHELKHRYWEQNEIGLMRLPLPVGDYILLNDRVQNVIDRKNKRGIKIKKEDLCGTYDIAIDTKKDILELCGNLTQEHDRFKDECDHAVDLGVQLIVLVENEDGITDLQDLHEWVNPRLLIRKYGRQVYPRATKGVTLMKQCMSMEKNHGVKFLFCHPYEAGSAIVHYLSGGGG